MIYNTFIYPCLVMTTMKSSSSLTSCLSKILGKCPLFSSKEVALSLSTQCLEWSRMGLWSRSTCGGTLNRIPLRGKPRLWVGLWYALFFFHNIKKVLKQKSFFVLFPIWSIYKPNRVIFQLCFVNSFFYLIEPS